MMKKIRGLNQNGFSMLEMLIVVGLSSMLFYTMFVVLQKGDDQVQVAQVKMHVEENAREGIYRLMQDLRQSAPDRITINGGGASIQFSVPSGGSSFSNDYSIDWASADTIQYALGGTNGVQLIRTNLTTGTTRVIANDFTAINFAGDSADPNVVTITASVQRSTVDGTLIPATPLQLTTQAEIRNI